MIGFGKFCEYQISRLLVSVVGLPGTKQRRDSQQIIINFISLEMQ